ncbi:MAG: hypothetical protein ACYCV7_11240 [Acidimicrobiales bacterium]
MKLLALPKTIGLVGILAGSALLAGGGGLGAVALASAQPAGALSAQLPAVGVREQNVNAAGRIRVALPKGGIGLSGNVSVNNFPKTQGVSGTVNVGNLPTNAAGRVQTQNGRGQSQLAQAWAVTINNAGITPVNVSGSGVFKGLVLSAYQDGNAGCNFAFVTIDGRQMLGDTIGGASAFGSTNPAVGGSNPNGGGMNFLYFTPPGGLPFHSSLNVHLSNGCGGQTSPIAYRIWYTTGG